MATYNEQIGWLCEAIDSIMHQTFANFEYIIILDNPLRCDIKEIVLSYQKADQRIVILENEKNLGAAKARNKGINLAKGKYVAVMDADDISLPERLEKQYLFMEENGEVGICGTKIRLFGKDQIHQIALDEL